MDIIFIGDLFREALFIVLLVVLVIVLPSLLVGLVVATFQAATQINEQTLSFLPRFVVTIGMIIIAGPWIVRTILDYVERIYVDMPYIIG